MTRFDTLPVLVQNMACFWALAAVFCFLTAYFVLHLCRELTEWRLYGQIAPVASELIKAPYFAYFAVLLALSAGGRPYEGTLSIYVTADADDAGVSQVDLTVFEK